jgi:hypothetical protein
LYCLGFQKYSPQHSVGFSFQDDDADLKQPEHGAAESNPSALGGHAVGDGTVPGGMGSSAPKNNVEADSNANGASGGEPAFPFIFMSSDGAVWKIAYTSNVLTIHIHCMSHALFTRSKLGLQ